MIVKVSALIVYDNKILGVLKKKHQNFWILPGGKVWNNEKLKSALYRELWEELEIVKRNVKSMKYLMDFSTSSQFSKDELLTKLFKVVLYDNNKINPSHEILKYSWIDVNTANQRNDIATGFSDIVIPMIKEKKILWEA